jgi:hypothetical protein
MSLALAWKHLKINSGAGQYSFGDDDEDYY